MSTTTRPRWFAVLLSCQTSTDRPTYDLSTDEVARRIDLDTDDCDGVTILDATEWEVDSESEEGRKVCFRSNLLVDCETPEDAVEALSNWASVFVPGYDCEGFDVQEVEG